MITPYDRVRERYHNDPYFHAVVDTIRKAILDLRLTPHECREAAMLASLMYEETKTHPVRIVDIEGRRFVEWPDGEGK